MYANYWGLIALTLGPIVLLINLISFINYYFFNKSPKFYIAFILLIGLTLVLPFILSQAPLSIRDILADYFFFGLTYYIPMLGSLKISKSKSDFAAYLFVFSIAGFIIYITGGQFSSFPPQ